MKKQFFQIVQTLVLLTIGIPIQAQNTGLPPALAKVIESPRHFRAMFYNCENFFDTYNDSLINDEEFLPDGDKHWTPYHYYTKVNQISKVITAIGGWTPPDIVGLCEIENYSVLYDLTHKSALYTQEYKIIHKESPDSRGIDVALLYQPKTFKPLHTQFIFVKFPENNSRTTRDILYTTGLIHGKDTLHVFVNHWPSRWGGQLESEDRRMFVASLVREKVDSILSTSPKAFILITGDLNDEPNNKSITESLNAQAVPDSVQENQIYDLSYNLQFEHNEGSYKHDGYWGIIDHLIVSGALLNKQNSLYTSVENAHIFKAPFLLEKDNTNVGEKPFRTYSGFKYLGGYSDHLPVFIDLQLNKTNP